MKHILQHWNLAHRYFKEMELQQALFAAPAWKSLYPVGPRRKYMAGMHTRTDCSDDKCGFVRNTIMGNTGRMLTNRRTSTVSCV